MGFGKKRNGIKPLNVKDVDFNTWSPFNRRALAMYMSPTVFRQVEDMAKKDRATALTQFVNDPAYAERAQSFYDLVILDKVPSSVSSSKVPENDVEKRFLLLCHEFLQGKDQDFSDRMSAILKEFNGDTLPTLAKKALSEAAEKYRPIVIKEAGKKRKIKGVLPPEFERMVQLASARIPIMLVGPAGCGKTYLCEKLAEALGLEFSDQSCSEGMSESVFNGLLLPILPGGQFDHVMSPFMQRYEKGGVMLLDEMDAGDPNLFTYINKAIANTSYTVAQRWKKPVLKKHEDFVLVAAANTFGHGADAMYVGRNQLDAATLDRFKVGLITMDYSEDVEASIAGEDLCAWAWGIRKRIREHRLRRIMSTRVIKDLAAMTAQYGWGKDEWEAAYFTGWSDDERRMVA